MNKSKLAENSFYIHDDDKSLNENSIDKGKFGDINNLNYSKVFITEISRKDSDGAERFIHQGNHQRHHSEGSNLKNITSLADEDKERDRERDRERERERDRNRDRERERDRNRDRDRERDRERYRERERERERENKYKRRSSYISVNSGDEEDGDLSMYQEILSSQKTNYRISRGNLTIKTENGEEKVKPSNKKKHYSVDSSISSCSVPTPSFSTPSMTTPSLTSPSLSFQSQTQTIQEDDDEEAKKRMDDLKRDTQLTDADKKISISKTFSSFMNQFDEEIKKDNEEEISIDNESTIKNESNKNDDLSPITPTEEYFNKALSELAALSNLSKK